MIIKAVHPEAELDLCQVLYFKTQRLVIIDNPLDTSTHQHILVAKYSDGKCYTIHNFGTHGRRASRARKHLENLFNAVCCVENWNTGIKPQPQTLEHG